MTDQNNENIIFPQKKTFRVYARSTTSSRACILVSLTPFFPGFKSHYYYYIGPNLLCPQLRYPEVQKLIDSGSFLRVLTNHPRLNVNSQYLTCSSFNAKIPVHKSYLLNINGPKPSSFGSSDL